MANVVVSINSGTISVDNHTVTVSKAAKHTVNWISHDGPFNIVFKPGSDWPNPATTSDGNKWKAVTGPFVGDGSLFYAVTADGATPLDPEIEIIP